MPSITQLEYIITVDELKNFSRAAKSCHVSQPSLSAQIQKVEEELQTIIFDRSQKPIRTTAKGEEIIKQSKSVLIEHRKLFDITNDSGILTGNFHLAVIPSLASSLLPLFIESFAKKHPQVKLKISEYKTDDIITALYDDHIDAGLLVTPLYNDRLIERTLFYEQFVAFASSDHQMMKRKTISEKDLDPDTVWLLEEGHCFRDQVIKVCQVPRQKGVLQNINFASGNLETLINLIRKGKGYTLLPELATMHLPVKELKNNIRAFKKPIPTREVSLVHSRSFLKQNIIEAIESEIVEMLPPQIKSYKRKNMQVIDI